MHRSKEKTLGIIATEEFLKYVDTFGIFFAKSDPILKK